ncbi:hypothetical protein TNCV_3971021 [Trichonephila clavipes]|nr:hypothetical protein TNCV_3971021 [Trichonephila clavipes]
MIELGTAVVSDCWKSYERLSGRGYHHLTVNHSLEFVDSETGAHTNTIEVTWRHFTKLPCLNIIEKEDLKDISPGTCSGKFVSLSKRTHSLNFLT